MARDTYSYFRSNHPDVIAAWHAHTKLMEKHHRACNRFVKKWSPVEGLKLYCTQRDRTPRYLASVTFKDRKGLPAAWAMYDRDASKIRPRESGKVDRDLLAAWRKLNETAGDIQLPGMPQHAGFFSSPGIELRDDGYVYVEWGASFEDVHAASFTRGDERSVKLDLSLWAHLKASEWHAIIEAADEAKAKEKVA